MESQRIWRIATILMLFLYGAHAFHFHGSIPRDFRKGDLLEVKMNELTSTKTLVPYSYYSLPYCHPTKTDNAEIHGERLHDHPMGSSPYQFKMWEPQSCKVLCRFIVDAKSAQEIKEKIYYEYRVNMILDDLPLLMPIQLFDNEDSPYSNHLELGFHIGVIGNYVSMNMSFEDGFYIINNHLAFTVKYHRDSETDSARIVGFEVKPFSIKHEYEGKWNRNNDLITCGKEAFHSADFLKVEEEKEIIFTYEVEFQETNVKWESRWDAYLLTWHHKIQWLSIISSLTIVLLLSGMLTMLMLKTLFCDISKYNELNSQEEASEKTGWKLIHGDVFRPPPNSDLLCVYVGTGVQTFGMVLAILIFAIFGILSPSNRGLLMTAMLTLWVLMGVFAGYASARLYKTFKGTKWKKMALETGIMFPVTVFAIFLVMNYLFRSQNSTGAVPFRMMFALGFLVLGISVSLVFVGSFLGYKKNISEGPVETNSIPRQIPKQTWYMNPVFSILIGGMLPFGAVYHELFFILASVSLNQFIYINSFLFFVFIILLIVCAETTILLCYFHLCREDYQWWWRSYLTSGSLALYVFLHATYLLVFDIRKPVSVMIYFGYLLIASYAFFVVTGTVGFVACFWFTRLLYSSVKFD